MDIHEFPHSDDFKDLSGPRAPLSRLTEVALGTVDQPKIVPSESQRIYLHVGHPPYDQTALRAAAKDVKVWIFRERDPGHPERGRFFMPKQDPIPEGLLPFLTPSAANAEWDAGQQDAAQRALMAGAAAGLSGQVGAYAIAMPDPEKDPDGYAAVQRRLRQVGPGTRAAVQQAIQRLITTLPASHTTPFRRTIGVLKDMDHQRSPTRGLVR